LALNVAADMEATGDMEERENVTSTKQLDETL